jgi:hypothetical protein
MKLCRSLYARPEILGGEQCAEARFGRRSDRAAGWSCGRQSRAGRWPTAEPSWLPSAAGVVHRNTVGWPSARPLGMVAQGVRMPAVPSSACRCPRSASGVQCLVRVFSITRACPGGRCPVSGAASERPDVRRPVSGVGVRCPWVPASTVVGREVVEGWRWAGSRVAGMAVVGVVACLIQGQFVVGWGRNLAVEAGAGRAGSAEGSGWTWPSWEVVGQWLGRPRGRPGLAGWTRESPVGGEPGCAARRRLRCVVIV